MQFIANRTKYKENINKEASGMERDKNSGIA